MFGVTDWWARGAAIFGAVLAVPGVVFPYASHRRQRQDVRGRLSGVRGGFLLGVLTVTNRSPHDVHVKRVVLQVRRRFSVSYKSVGFFTHGREATRRVLVVGDGDEITIRAHDSDTWKIVVEYEWENLPPGAHIAFQRLARYRAVVMLGTKDVKTRGTRFVSSYRLRETPTDQLRGKQMQPATGDQTA